MSTTTDHAAAVGPTAAQAMAQLRTLTCPRCSKRVAITVDERVDVAMHCRCTRQELDAQFEERHGPACAAIAAGIVSQPSLRDIANAQRAEFEATGKVTLTGFEHLDHAAQRPAIDSDDEDDVADLCPRCEGEGCHVCALTGRVLPNGGDVSDE